MGRTDAFPDGPRPDPGSDAGHDGLRKVTNVLSEYICSGGRQGSPPTTPIDFGRCAESFRPVVPPDELSTT